RHEMALHTRGPLGDVPRARRVRSAPADEPGEALAGARVHGDAHASAAAYGSGRSSVSAVRDKLEEELGARSVGGVEIDGRDVPVAFAASQEQVVLLLELARAQGWSVLPIGSGTKLERG